MRATMKQIAAALLICIAAAVAHAEDAPQKRVELLCHRTANEDVPENTLESLKQAALLGCDVVEIDVRRTLDGKLVLNHDGVLERLTDGIGDTEGAITTIFACAMPAAGWEIASRACRFRSSRMPCGSPETSIYV